MVFNNDLMKNENIFPTSNAACANASPNSYKFIKAKVYFNK